MMKGLQVCVPSALNADGWTGVIWRDIARLSFF
jgi:hypothetical protein